MGFLDRLANFLGLRKAEASVIVVGLDNSGKSTLLNHFKPEEEKSPDIVPTVGFNVEKFKSESKSKLYHYHETSSIANYSIPLILAKINQCNDM